MEWKLFVLLFLSGFVPLVPSVPRKYYLILQSKTWTEAQTYCRSTHTDLATIETAAEMIQLQTEAQNHQFTSSAWIGLWDDINSWRWVLGEEPLGSFTDWNLAASPREPNNRGGNQTCVAIHQQIWNDLKCATTLSFMCFDDRRTGTGRYIYYPDLKTWPAARSFCRGSHTDLASSRDSTENSIIQQKLSTAATWFGLYRDSWKWVDQTNPSTISWKSGQPDNAQWNEDCGFVSNGLVADGRCSDLKPFFCYREITGQQIIRMKVQSNQNVNHPAVKAALLEQIKQELKDRGMENVTVKWREQSDGKVFQKIDEDESSSAESSSSSRCEV